MSTIASASVLAHGGVDSTIVRQARLSQLRNPQLHPALIALVVATATARTLNSVRDHRTLGHGPG